MQIFIVVSQIQNRRTKKMETLFLTDAVNMLGDRRYGMEQDNASLYETREAAEQDALANKGTVRSV